MLPGKGCSAFLIFYRNPVSSACVALTLIHTGMQSHALHILAHRVFFNASPPQWKTEDHLPSQFFSSHNAVRSNWGISGTKLSCSSSASWFLCCLVSDILGCSWIFIVGLCKNSTGSPKRDCSPKCKTICSDSTPSECNLPSPSC